MKIIMIVLLLSSISYGKFFNKKSFISKLAGKNVGKLAREVKESSMTKKLVLQKISLNSPSIDIVSSVAKNISTKSKFGDALISKTNYPTDVVRQYSIYGNAYIDTLQEFNKKSLSLNKVDIQNFKKKFPSMPKIDFENSQVFNDRMVQTLKHTGKKGWEVSQKIFTLAQKNPKKSGVAILMAWYVADPESFFEQKEKLIASVGSILQEGSSDVTKLALGASSGIADGFISVIKEKMNFGNVMVLLLAFFSFMIWKLRLYIKQYFKIKLENFLKKEKNKSKNIENNKNNEGLL